MTTRKAYKTTTVPLVYRSSNYRSVLVDVPMSQCLHGYAIVHPWTLAGRWAQVEIFATPRLLYHIPTGQLLWKFKDEKQAVEVATWLNVLVPELAYFTTTKKETHAALWLDTEWPYWYCRAEGVLNKWMAYKHGEGQALTVYKTAA